MTAGALAGRRALVTGGSGGLGAAVCRTLADRGADVVVSGRDRDRIAGTVDAVRARGRTGVGLAADLRSPPEVDALVAAAVRALGGLDLVVAAAGVAGPAGVPRPVAGTSLDEWAGVLDTNLRGVFLLCRAAFVAMAGSGGDVVTVVSARAGTAGHPYAAAYSASKLGVAGLSEALAEAGRATGIRVQALFPDAVDTALLVGSAVRGPRLDPDRVAEVLADLVAAPADTALVAPLLTSPGAPRADTRRLAVLR